MAGSHELPYVPLYISNKPIHTPVSESFHVHNPLTAQAVSSSASLSLSSPHFQALLESSSSAFSSWSSTLMPERRQILLKAAELAQSDRYRDKIISSTMKETGASREWSAITWKGGVDGFYWAAGSTGGLLGEAGEWWESDKIKGAEVVVQRRPLGVVFSIAPWNAPFTLSVRAVAVPIMCGNTVILKSSECSPRSQAFVAEILYEAGLPPGVLNFISCSREDAPSVTAKIIGHPSVKKVTFTGSDKVAKIIAAEASKYLKPCVFELGGKAPVIVMEDANLVEAAKAIVFGSMIHAGQVCMSTERVIAHESICTPLLGHMKDLVSKLKSGDVSNSASSGTESITDGSKMPNLPPLFTTQSAENVLGLIRDAQKEGAEVVVGDMTRDGAVVQPHVLVGVKKDMRIWSQETFGPVLILTPFSTSDEALSLANDSDYSLTSALWTTNLHTALEMAPKIHAGYVNINGPTIHSESKRGLEGLGGGSGYGAFGVEDFTTRRAMVMHPRATRDYPLFG